MSDERKEIEGDIPNLDTDWDDGEYAYKKTKVEKFLREMLGQGLSKVRTVNNGDGTQTARFFATDDRADLWESDPETYASYCLATITYMVGSATEGYTLAARVTQTLTSPMVMGASNVVKFTYNSYWGDASDLDTEAGYARFTVNGSEVADLEMSLVAGGREYEADLGPWLTQETNSVKLVVGNAHGQTRTWNFAVKAVQLILSLDGSYDESQLRESNWKLRVKTQGVAAIVHLLIDGAEASKASVNNTTYDFTIDAADTLAAGTHKIELYGENTEYGLTTDTITTYFAKKGLSTPSVGIGAAAASTVSLYGTAVIPYYFYHPGAAAGDEVSVEFAILTPGGATLATLGTQVVTALADGTSGMQELRWVPSESSLLDYDYVTVRVKVGAAWCDHSLAITDAGVELEAAAECKVLLSAAGKTNADAEAEDWTSSYDGEVTARVVRSGNFLLNSANGFGGDAYTIKLGKSITLQGCQPFATDFGANNTAAAQRTGKTIEIEFETQDCVDTTALVASCMADGVGFEVYADHAVLGSGDTRIEVRYGDEERIRLGFVIDGSTTHCVNELVDGTEESDCNIAYLYVNGVICRLMDYKTASWRQYNPVPITMGSDACTVKLYALRIYDKALTYKQMIGNYAYDTPELADKIAITQRNAVLNSAGEVDFNLVGAALPSTPYKIWTLERMPTGKKDYVACDTEFVNPRWREDSDGQAMAPFTCLGHTVALDDTSSLSYPDPYKNWANKYGGGTWTAHLGDTDVTILSYSITAGIDGGETEFVDKVNFASSEGIGNILAMNMYHQILTGAASQYPNVLTPPQKSELAARGRVTSRMSLSGFPIIGYRKATSGGVTQTKFLSIYNFINNKYSPSIFGADSSGEIEVWEVEDNVNFFQEEIDEGSFAGSAWTDRLTELYYARVPKTSPTTGRDYGKAATSSEAAAARAEGRRLRRFHNWVVSCNPTVAERYKTLYGSYKALDASVTYGDATYAEDSPEYRIAKFQNEYAGYLSKESAMAYFLFCNWILGTDSMDKNMSVAFFSDSDIAYFALRDTDTIWVFTNTGVMKWKVYHEWGDSYDESTDTTGAVDGETYNASTGTWSAHCTAGSPVFNGRLSGLWDCVARGFASDLPGMYAAMRSAGLNEADMMAKFDEFWGQWCEALYDADGMGYANTGRFDMAHGDKREVAKAFMKGRQRYMDSKYGANTSKTLELRLWGSGSGVALRHSTALYSALNWGAGGILTQRNITPGEPSYFPSTGASFAQTTFTVYDADLLTSITTYIEKPDGTKAEYGLQGISDSLDVTGLGNCAKLRSLELDYSDKDANTDLSSRVWDVGASIALESIVVRNCPNATGVCDFKSEVLRSVDLRDTPCSGVTFAESTALASVQLGADVTDIALSNLPSLSTFTLQGVSKVRKLSVAGCPKVATRQILERILALSDNVLQSVTLHGIDWDEFSPDYLAALGRINYDLTGKITYGALTFAQKLALAATDIGKTADFVATQDLASAAINPDKLTIVYPRVHLQSVSIVGPDYVASTKDIVTFSPVVNPTGGNDFHSYEWSLTSDLYAEIDPVTGVFRAKQVFSASEPRSVSVVLTIHLEDGADITATKSVALYEREVEVGDAVYADGTTSAPDSIDATKTVVGYCFYINPNDKAERLCCMAKDLITGATWGPASNATLNDSTTVSYNIPLLPELSASVNPTDAGYLDSTQADGFAVQNIAKAGLNYGFMELSQEVNDGDEISYPTGSRLPVGRAYTLDIIRIRNKVIKDPSFSSKCPLPASGVSGAGMLAAFQSCLASGSNNLWYFIAASYCYYYQPAVKTTETLASCFQQGKWFLPTPGDIARIWYQQNAGKFAGAKELGYYNNLNSSYWSCAEHSSGSGQNAWFIAASNGSLGNYNKTDARSVRAIAAF